MNKKITLNSLAEQIAKECDITLQEAELRIRAYFDIIGDTITAGENVKVKGLGTFKAVGIEARESVDVSSGRRVVIPGHRRPSFTPEKALAEKVNEPFASFEAVELSDELTESELETISSEQDISGTSHEFITENGSDEIVQSNHTEQSVQTDSEIPINDSKNVIKDNETESESEETVSETQVINEQTVFDEVIEPSETDNKPSENEIKADERLSVNEVTEEESPKPIDTTEEDVIIEPNPIEKETEEESEAEIEEKDKEIKRLSDLQKNHFLNGFLIGLACTFALLISIWCWYRFAPESFDNILGRPKVEEVIVAEQIVSTPENPETQENEVTNEEPSIAQNSATSGIVAKEQVAETKAHVPTEPSDVEIKKEEKKEKENKAEESEEKVVEQKPVYDTISKTRFLTTMARDHYGSYYLWPYIYMENSSFLGHPDRIKPGTKVVIPPAEKYGINAKNKECIAKAKKLGVEIYARYK